MSHSSFTRKIEEQLNKVALRVRMQTAEVWSALGPAWEEVRAVCGIQREVKHEVSVTGVEGNKEGTEGKKSPQLWSEEVTESLKEWSGTGMAVEMEKADEAKKQLILDIICMFVKWSEGRKNQALSMAA